MSKIQKDIQDSIRIYRELQETFKDGEGNVLIEMFIATLNQIIGSVEREHRNIYTLLTTNIMLMRDLADVSDKDKDKDKYNFGRTQLSIAQDEIEALINGEDINESCPTEGV